MTKSNLINTAWKITAIPYTHYPRSEFIIVQLLDEGFKFFHVRDSEIVGGIRDADNKSEWKIEDNKLSIIFKGLNLDNVYQAQVDEFSANNLNGKFYRTNREDDIREWSAEKVDFTKIIDELEREKQKRIDNSVKISAKEIIDKIWKVFGYENEEAGELSILNHIYETSAPHVCIDYMLSNTLVGSDGITRLDNECPLSDECYNLEKGDEDYDEDRLLKEERISVRLWYYLVDNIESEYQNFIDNSDTEDFFEKGKIYSRDDIESSINEWWDKFLRLFSDYTILSDEEAEEICDTCDLSDDDIYELCLEFDNLKEIKMENLSSDWNNDSFYIV